MIAVVLHFPSPPKSNSLVLREVVCGRGGELTEWFKSNVGARAKFRVRVQNLRRVSRAEWNKKQFRYLENGLAEIKWKWKDGKKEFRAIGFDHAGAFVMLVGCSHKQNVYDPPRVMSTAKRLKGEVENGKWKTASFEP